MKNRLICCLFLFVLFHPLSGQDRYGLAVGNKILHAGDTVSLSYPSGSIVICDLIDNQGNILGKAPATWSISGTVTIVDTPLTAPQVPIDASRALKDERGYLTATALESGAQWICNRVFLKIKGKNSRVLNDRVFTGIIQKHQRYFIYDVAGRLHGEYWETPSQPLSKQPSTIVIMHNAGDDRGEETAYFRR
jgi:hypothetical protein